MATQNPPYDEEILFAEMPAVPEELFSITPQQIEQLTYAPLNALAEVMEFVSDMPFVLFTS
jgi:hypothetical protein